MGGWHRRRGAICARGPLPILEEHIIVVIAIIPRVEISEQRLGLGSPRRPARLWCRPGGQGAPVAIIVGASLCKASGAPAKHAPPRTVHHTASTCQ